MGNIASLLINLDTDKLKRRPTVKMEVKRLSELLGEPAIITIQAIPPKRYMEYAANVFGKNGEPNAAKMYEAMKMVAISGLVEPSMKDKDAMEKHGCSTPEELIELVFTAAEIQTIGTKITEISGMTGDTIKEIKN